jgi:hypothetical protein
MTREKKVTDAVIAANQRNSQDSTGPKTARGKATSRLNALKHRLTATIDVPASSGDDSEQPERQRWRNHYQPQGPWEEALVREIAALQKKLSRLETLENHEISKFEAQIHGVDSVFDSELKLPIEGIDLPIELGWSCERLIVRASSTEDETHLSGSRGPVLNQGQPVPGYQGTKGAHGNDGRRLEIQAELGLRLDQILRYRAALRKDLYRAVEALRAAQEDRRERGARDKKA